MTDTNLPQGLFAIVDKFLRTAAGEATDWGAVVQICESCGSNPRYTEEIIKIILLKLKEIPKTPEHILVNTLILLDSLVKNVSSALPFASSTDTCKLLEKVAKLKEKKLAKKNPKPGSSLVSDDNPEITVGSSEDRAMRMYQSWGMLHPEHFKKYLERYQQWKKDGVVFPPAEAEDLVPLAAKKSQQQQKASTQSQQQQQQQRSPSQVPEVRVSQQVKNELDQARECSTLLFELCSQRDSTTPDDLIQHLISQCKELQKKFTLYIQSLVDSGKSAGKSETEYEAYLNLLLKTNEQLETAISASISSTSQPKKSSQIPQQPRSTLPTNPPPNQQNPAASAPSIGQQMELLPGLIPVVSIALQDPTNRSIPQKQSQNQSQTTTNTTTTTTTVPVISVPSSALNSNHTNNTGPFSDQTNKSSTQSPRTILINQLVNNQNQSQIQQQQVVQGGLTTNNLNPFVNPPPPYANPGSYSFPQTVPTQTIPQTTANQSIQQNQQQQQPVSQSQAGNYLDQLLGLPISTALPNTTATTTTNVQQTSQSQSQQQQATNRDPMLDFFRS